MLKTPDPMPHNSGKLLILAMLLVGLVAAGTSWWFRYSATHKAVRFWGPEGARLIRDAPHVTLVRYEILPDGRTWRVETRRDISKAPGLTHLRNALLEDRSFNWQISYSPPTKAWTHSLEFKDGHIAGKSFTISFSPDFRWMCGGSDRDSSKRAVSCRPIAAGLSEFFSELTNEAVDATAAEER